MDDVSNGVFILPTLAEHLLALRHRLRHRLGAWGQVASLQHLKNESKNKGTSIFLVDIFSLCVSW